MWTKSMKDCWAAFGKEKVIEVKEVTEEKVKYSK